MFAENNIASTVKSRGSLKFLQRSLNRPLKLKLRSRKGLIWSVHTYNHTQTILAVQTSLSAPCCSWPKKAQGCAGRADIECRLSLVEAHIFADAANSHFPPFLKVSYPVLYLERITRLPAREPPPHSNNKTGAVVGQFGTNRVLILTARRRFHAPLRKPDRESAALPLCLG